MAGYGYYSGVGSSPYYVGQDQEQAGQSSGVQPAEWDPNAGAIVPKETQAQMSPGAYGAASYASMMPQWMQDYFDAQNMEQQGTAGINAQRALAMEKLPQLQQQYGMNAAMNPYFTQQNVGKGFDPFNNSVYTNQTFDENPELMGITTTQRNPFSGAELGQSKSYVPIQPGGDPKQLSGYETLTRPYGGKDFRRDAMTFGLYSQATRVPSGIMQANKDVYNKAKKLW